MISKEELNRKQAEMKARHQKEREAAKQKFTDLMHATILHTEVTKNDRQICTVCNSRVARFGSPYCSRCSSTGQIETLRDTLPSLGPKKYYQIWARQNGGSIMLGESETLEEALLYYRKAEENGQHPFGIKHPGGSWHGFEEESWQTTGNEAKFPVPSADQTYTTGKSGDRTTENRLMNNTSVKSVESNGGLKELTPNSNGTYTRKQASIIIGVSATTLMRWERNGYIEQPLRTGVTAISPGGCVYTEEMIQKAKLFMEQHYRPEQAHIAPPPGSPQALPAVVKRTIKVNRRMERAVASKLGLKRFF